MHKRYSAAACFMLISGVAAVPASEARSQEAVPFQCTSSGTVSHQLSSAVGSLSFESQSCICGGSPEIAKALLIQILSTPPERRSEVLARAAKFSWRVSVQEGETVSEKIFCYDKQTVEGLIAAIPDAGNRTSPASGTSD
jgi:hypothetical protein